MAAKKNRNGDSNNSNLNLQTLEYLGLTKQPFGSEILSDASFFNLPALQKINENLIHQAQFSELLLIVEGPQGSGKTSLYRRFIQEDINNTKILSIHAEATDTLVQIQQKMSMHMQDLGDANHLEENLRSLEMFDQTPLLVIDSSHVLSDTTLQELVRFQSQLKEEQITLKILLFANIGMAETLQKITDLPVASMYVQKMPHYSHKQIQSYLMHRLQQAGYSGEPILGTTDLQALIKKCDGTPLSIMKHAAPIIDKNVARKVSPGMSGALKWVLLIVLLLGAGAAAIYFLGLHKLLLDEKPAAPPGSTAQTQAITRQPPAIKAPVKTQPEAVSTRPSPQQAINKLPPATTPKTPLREPAQPSQKAPVQTKPLKAASPDQPTRLPTHQAVQMADQIARQTPAKPAPAKPPSQTKQTQTQELAQKLAQKPLQKPGQEPGQKPMQKPAPKPVQKTNSASNTPLKPATHHSHPALRQLAAMGVRDANWLRQQPATAWTLQLLGARGPETLLKFALTHRLGSRAAWYKTWLNGKPYYVMVLGSYADRDRARASINTLPASLRKLKPWVKSMRAIHKSIK